MGTWSSTSKTHVSSMSEGDFYGSEKSVTVQSATSVDIVFRNSNGQKVLKSGIKLQQSEIIDCSVMDLGKLKMFISNEINDAFKKGILFSLHMKATMMKVSDPIIFGAVVSVFYDEIFKKYHKEVEELGIDVNNGIGDLYSKISGHPLQSEIENSIEEL